jgi:hypothetical protein
LAGQFLRVKKLKGSSMHSPSVAAVVGRRLIAAALFAFLCFHVLMIGMYNLPDNLLVPMLKKPLNSYVIPFFGQNWSLFAPDPGGYVASYRFRFRYRFAEGGASVTPFIDAGAMLPAGLSSPFSSMSLLREISYSCASLAENEAAKAAKANKAYRVSLDPNVETIDAGRLGPSDTCVARVALSFANKVRAAYSPTDSRRPADTAVQIAYTLAAARRVGDAFKGGAGPAPALKQNIVHVTPWLVSGPVYEVPLSVEAIQ